MIRKNSGLIVALLVFLFLLAISVWPAHGQSTTIVSRRCPGASPSPATAKVEVTKVGDINLVPCSTKSININGTGTTGLLTTLNGLTAASQTFAAPTAADTAAWSSVTSTHTLQLPITAVSGSSRTNFVPYFNAANTFASSPFSWNGTLYNFQNTAKDNTFQLQFTPSSTVGLFTVGLTGNQWKVDQNSGTGSIVNSVSIELNAPTLLINNVSTYNLLRTVTAGGTTGNQTINKPAGTVNIAAGAAAVTVTNSTVTATSIVFTVTRTADATCTNIRSVVPASGSFVITLNANCTAETSIGFLVTN